MGIKASRSELTDLLSTDEGTVGAFTSHQPSQSKNARLAAIEAAMPAPPKTEAFQPPPPSIQPTRGNWRSQGLTIYESDDDLVESFLDYTRKQKLKIGRKKGFSLFARAGLRALDELLKRDPDAFEATLIRALREQAMD